MGRGYLGPRTRFSYFYVGLDRLAIINSEIRQKNYILGPTDFTSTVFFRTISLEAIKIILKLSYY